MNPVRTNIDILPDSQKNIWPLLSPLCEKCVLYGGTAIALRLGHRTSIDFDFFSNESFDESYIYEKVPILKEAEIIQKEKNTLSMILSCPEPVKFSFFTELNCGRVGEPEKDSYSKVMMASLQDLFSHKLKVILQRAEKKDYLDIVALLKYGLLLEKGLSGAEAIFRNAFPSMECLKALVFFEEGDLSELYPEDQELLIERVQEVELSKFNVELLSDSLL